jgi:hypothetical protein
VVVEHHDEDHNEFWVVSALPARRGEELTLELAEPGRSLTVRVLENSPVLVEGFIRHRLRLCVVA